jgi:hypothetical protein
MNETLTHRRSLLFAAMLMEGPSNRPISGEPEELAIGRALADRLAAVLSDTSERARAVETLRMAAAST